MTDIDKCKALAKLGYSQELKFGYPYYWDGDKAIYIPEVEPDGEVVAIPTVEGLMEWIWEMTNGGETSLHKSPSGWYAVSGKGIEMTISDNFPTALDALLDLLKKMGVIE